jgi:hypothetical protein
MSRGQVAPNVPQFWAQNLATALFMPDEAGFLTASTAKDQAQTLTTTPPR